MDALSTLDIRGPRGGLTGERARELAAEVLSGERLDVRRVIFSTWALSVEAAVVLAEAIAALPDLESAVLADIIAGRPEAEGLAVYRALGAALKDKQLTEIDLSDNAVGPKGVEACRTFLSCQARLQTMLWCNCGISAEAARSIADIVLFRTPTVLTTLHFFNNMSGNGGAVAVADIVRASPQLRDFRFSSSRGGNEGGVALAAALRHTVGTLTKLDLNDNTFGVRGGVALGATLRWADRLTYLNLGDVAMEDEGVAALASGLVRSGSAHTLETLILSANDITAEGAAAVARCVRRCTRLRVVDVSENLLGGTGAALIARAITRRAAFRSLAGGGVGEEDPLEEVLLNGIEATTRGAVAVASAAGACLPRLSRLSLADNELSAAGAAAVRAALAAGGRTGAGVDSILEGMEDGSGDDGDDGDEEDDEEEGEGAA